MQSCTWTHISSDTDASQSGLYIYEKKKELLVNYSYINKQLHKSLSQIEYI